MLDSGLTAELITPELRQHLGIKGSKGKVAGLAAGGASAAGDLVSLSVRHSLCFAYLHTGAQQLVQCLCSTVGRTRLRVGSRWSIKSRRPCDRGQAGSLSVAMP
jgi:hypothetical protein